MFLGAVRQHVKGQTWKTTLKYSSDLAITQLNCVKNIMIWSRIEEFHDLIQNWRWIEETLSLEREREHENWEAKSSRHISLMSNEWPCLPMHSSAHGEGSIIFEG